MNRKEAITEIEALYPTDSQYPKTNEVGERLLKQAKMEKESWRTESTEVLIRYAELCQQEEKTQNRHDFLNRHGHY